MIIIHIQIHDYKYKMKYNNNRYDFTDLIKLYSAAAFINGDRYSAANLHPSPPPNLFISLISSNILFMRFLDQNKFNERERFGFNKR